MPKSDSLAKIADYLNCSVDYLLGRTENPDIYRDENKILYYFNSLNDEGQNKLTKYAEDISRIDEYKKGTTTEKQKIG